MELFLTSSVSRVAGDIAKKVDPAKAGKLVFITTAAEPETGDKTWLSDDWQALKDAGFAVTNYTITGKTSAGLEKDLADYDYIYLSGGNTLYLLKESQKSGFIPLVRDLVTKKGKIYIGTSAGSIIAGPKCPDYLLSDSQVQEIKNMEGYGLVNFTIVPHWGSADFRNLYLKGRMEIAYQPEQVPLVLLTDNQYVHVFDSCHEIIDVTK